MGGGARGPGRFARGRGAPGGRSCGARPRGRRPARRRAGAARRAGVHAAGAPTADDAWAPFGAASLVLPDARCSRHARRRDRDRVDRGGDADAHGARAALGSALERAPGSSSRAPTASSRGPVFAPLADRRRAAGARRLEAPRRHVRRGRRPRPARQGRARAAGRPCARPSSSTSRTPSAGSPASAPESTTYAFRRDGRTFLGATPERLVRTEGRDVPDRRRRRARSAAAQTPPRTPRSAAELLGVGEGPRGAGDRRRRDPRPAGADRRDARGRAGARRHDPAVRAAPRDRDLGHAAGGARACCRWPALLHPTPAVGGEPRDLALALHRGARGLRPGLVRGPDRLAGRRRRRRAVRRPALRDRRPDAGDAVRGLRDRRRLRPGRRVGGVADQAAGGRLGAGHPGRRTP